MTSPGADVERPCIAITYPYPLGARAAGGSRTTPELARHLARLGADVLVLPVSTNSLDRRFPRRPVAEAELGHHLDADLASEGVEIVRVPQHPVHHLLDGLCVKRTLEGILRERRVHAVLGHLHEAGALPGLCRARGAHFGYFATWQTYSFLADHRRRTGPAWWVRNRIDHRFIVEAHRRAEIVFAISESTRGELVEYLGVDPARIVLCPLGVGASFTSVSRPAREGIRNFLFFGRIIRWKGFLDAIEALGLLARQGIRDWTYRLLGTGHEAWARRAAAEHGIGDRVEVLPPVDDARLCEHLAWADLAILPSHHESFGLSIAEAQGAGLPVVAYAVGSVPEVVEDGVTGWLAPFQRTDRLAELIAEAVRDPEATRRAGERGRERVKRLFHWERTASIVLAGLRGLE